jgi:hypothetical protein
MCAARTVAYPSDHHHSDITLVTTPSITAADPCAQQESTPSTHWAVADERLNPYRFDVAVIRQSPEQPSTSGHSPGYASVDACPNITGNNAAARVLYRRVDGDRWS